MKMQAWNDGRDNIWKVDLAPWLKRHGAHAAGNTRPVPASVKPPQNPPKTTTR
jgi:hypothetical protein